MPAPLNPERYKIWIEERRLFAIAQASTRSQAEKLCIAEKISKALKGRKGRTVGKSYVELYGEERAAELIKKARARQPHNKGESLTETYGERANEMLMNIVKAGNILGDKLRGKTLQEIHGEEKAKEILARRIKSQRARATLDTQGGIQYYEWRQAVYKRDKDTCRICEKIVKGKDRHAHHLKPRRAFPELQYDLMNGITVCTACHKILEPESQRKGFLLVGFRIGFKQALQMRREKTKEDLTKDIERIFLDFESKITTVDELIKSMRGRK
jgi:hypothetical protein